MAIPLIYKADSCSYRYYFISMLKQKLFSNYFIIIA